MENLKLPKVAYGPICNKFIKDFMEYHKILGALPEPGDASEVVLAKIIDIMLRSMGKDNRDKCLQEAKEYLNSIPPAAR